MIVGRIVNGVYIRVNDERGAPTKGADYFKGVAPSDLAKLDSRQLFTAAERLHESVTSGVGTPSERANASEALSAVYRERRARRSTIR